MKLTWTFYPKAETESVTLTVVYVPELDTQELVGGGYLHAQSNTAFVDWSTYKRFDSSDIDGRRDAFKRLLTITQSGGVRTPAGTLILFPRQSPAQ